VVEQAEAFVAGHREVGVRTALKHFPGHGSATGDTHLGVVDVTSVWQAVELEPFRRLVTDGLTDAVLTAHVFNAALDPEHPATLSRPIVTGLLREQLGWDGVVISDDMQMGAIRAQYGYPEAVALAIEAGIDLLTIANQQVYEEGIVGSTIDLIEGLVRDGRISEARIAESTARLAAFSTVR
jgi:beta-N-acetylhexosaminidase